MRDRLRLVVGLGVLWLAVSVAGPALIAHAFPEPPPTYQHKWGSSGSGPGQFTNLEFLATDSSGNIYATDAYDPTVGNHRVQKFSSDGTFLTQWGTAGSGAGQFSSITGIAIDASNVVWVVDKSPGPTVYKRVQRFTAAGAYIDAPSWLQFNDIGGILFDPANGDVLAISVDPPFVRRFNTSGTQLAEFSVGALPRSGVMDSSGNLYLSLNRGQGPVAKYNSAGTHVPPLIDMAGNQLAIDPAGNLYGTSNNPTYGLNIVRKVSPAGVILTEWGGTGTGDGQFQSPSGLVRLSSGTIFVGEFDGKRIQRFGDGAGPPTPTHTPTVAVTFTPTPTWTPTSTPTPVTTNVSTAADTYVRNGADNTNEGASTFMRVRSSGQNRALVRFDQAAIQAAVNGGTLISAKLRMTITDNGENWGPSGRSVDAHRVTASWTEGNGWTDGNSPPNRGTGVGATWACASDSNIANQSKDCAGATEWEMGQPNQPQLHPWAQTATGSVTITSNQTGVVEWDVTADVAAFVSGSSQNYGWLIRKTDEGQNGLVHFGTRESGAPPQLVIVRQ